jgi:TorA maturation chaperone TorD
MAMRDPGLDQADRTAGGGALSRRIGISQPSLSNWFCVPAERVPLVERVTGIDRALLRPDLYATLDAGAVDEIDAACAREYALLSVLLRRVPDANLLARLAKLGADPSPLGVAHAGLGDAVAPANVAQIEREFFALFIGTGRGELVPYGSYYLIAFLNERPLARLRGDLARLGVERAAGEAEPEDRAALLCEIMSGLKRRSGRTASYSINSLAVDRPLLRRPRARERCQLLAPNRRGRAAVHRNRK